MQLIFILSILFAIVAVGFALQNNVPVTVTLGTWQVDGSLAIVLLAAMGVGALIASLVSSPSMIRSQSAAALLRRKLASLEERNVALERRMRELEHLPPAPEPAPPEPVRRSPGLGARSALLFQRRDTR